MMPMLDGIKTLMKLRESRNIPVILLSAKSEDNDKILGLTAGADDYVTKPFNPSELIARVKSQLRRYTSLGSIAICKTEIALEGTFKIITDGDLFKAIIEFSAIEK